MENFLFLISFIAGCQTAKPAEFFNMWIYLGTYLLNYSFLPFLPNDEKGRSFRLPETRHVFLDILLVLKIF